jgi:5-methylcytosine-specific restriction endonuclease McrA
MPYGVYERTKPVWNKGKIGLYKTSTETKRKQSIALIGIKRSDETRKKMRLAQSGKKLSEEHKRKIGEDSRKKGKCPPSRKGCVVSQETKDKISKARLGVPLYNQRGENSHCWKGGVSYFPYSVDWTDDLKRAIRKRDEYTCQLCGKEPAICVHHIDYNKKNCNPDSLITHCENCHSKTNFDREKWLEYFNLFK